MAQTRANSGTAGALAGASHHRADRVRLHTGDHAPLLSPCAVSSREPNCYLCLMSDLNLTPRLIQTVSGNWSQAVMDTVGVERAKEPPLRWGSVVLVVRPCLRIGLIRAALVADG